MITGREQGRVNRGAARTFEPWIIEGLADLAALNYRGFGRAAFVTPATSELMKRTTVDDVVDVYRADSRERNRHLVCLQHSERGLHKSPEVS